MEVSESGLLVFIRKGHFGLHHMTNEELVNLNLQHGLNEASCVIHGHEDSVIHFNLFLYSEGEKIVLSDVDGTITESDIKVKRWDFLEILCPFHDKGYVLGTYFDSIGNCQSARIRCRTL